MAKQQQSRKSQTRKVSITGLTPIMFDRYAGDNKTALQPGQRLYLSSEDRTTVVIPAMNVMSFFSAVNTQSAPKRLRDSRQYTKICNACLSFLTVGPPEIALHRDGKPIQFGGFDESGRDSKSGIYIHYSVARLAKGIPNPKARPTVPLPWEASFELTLFPNEEINETEVQNLLIDGGLAIGLGTFRGVFGKFSVTQWE